MPVKQMLLGQTQRTGIFTSHLPSTYRHTVRTYWWLSFSSPFFFFLLFFPPTRIMSFTFVTGWGRLGGSSIGVSLFFFRSISQFNERAGGISVLCFFFLLLFVFRSGLFFCRRGRVGCSLLSAKSTMCTPPLCMYVCLGGGKYVHVL